MHNSEKELKVLEGEYLPAIEGAGGKGGGGGDVHTPVEEDDTLSSRQRIRLLIAINHGVIKNTIPEVYLNGTLSSNFDVKVDWRRGLANQSRIPGFSDMEAPLDNFPSNGFQISTTTPYLSPDLSHDVSAVRIILSTNTLKKITDEGDRVGYSVRHSFYIRVNAGNWQFVTSSTKTGKCTSTYAWDVRITPSKYGFSPVEGETWQFKIERDTMDDPNDKYYSACSVAAVTKIFENSYYPAGLLNYNNVALIALTINDASQFGGSVPRAAFRSYLSELYLPTSYNPVSRVYSSNWNGAFKSYTEWSDNLSFVIYNVLVKLPAGLQLPAGDVDISSFYLFAQICDEMVDDGEGGTEPRFRCDIHFTERSDLSTFLTTLLALGNASFGTNDLGQLSIIYDRAGQTPTKLVTNANVINGRFDYSSNELDSRVTLVNVTYSDEELQGQTNTATQEATNVAGQNLVTRYGLQPSDIVLSGCIRESQAIRKARWAIWTNCIDTELVTFSNLFAGSFYQLGELITIMDSRNASDTHAHAVIKEIIPHTGYTEFVLDREWVLSPAKADPVTGLFYIQYLASDGITVQKKALRETSGTYTTVSVETLVTAWPQSPAILYGKLIPRVCKVIKKKLDDGVWTITAVAHSENKYGYIDTGIAKVGRSGSYKTFLVTSVPAPVSVSVEDHHISTATQQLTRLEVSWLWDVSHTQKYKPIFEYTWARDDDNFIRPVETTTRGFEIKNPFPGTYTITVWAKNPATGVKSPALTYVYPYRIVGAVSTLLPPENLYVTGTVGTIFNGKDCSFSWTYPIGNNSKSDALKDYKVEIVNATTLVTVGTYFVNPDPVKGGQFTLFYGENEGLFNGVARRQFSVRVYSRDLLGDISDPVFATFSNPLPEAILANTVDIFNGYQSAIFSYNRPDDNDWEGIILFMSTVSGFTPDKATNKVYLGKDTSITIAGLLENTPYYFRIASFDAFHNPVGNETDYVLTTTEFTTTVTSVAPIPTPEEIKTQLQTALDNATTPLVFNADAFAMKLNGVDATPFILGQIDGAPAILLDATVGVTGPLSASQLRTGALAATETIEIGNGNAVIDGNGSFIVYDGDKDIANRDFALFTGARLTFQRYRNGEYFEYKAVHRTETGIAESGTTVRLPGYWDTQPNIVVVPSSLQSYNAAQPGASQEWNVRYENLTELPYEGAEKTATRTVMPVTFVKTGDATIDQATGTVTRGNTTAGWSTAQCYTAEGTYENCEVSFKIATVEIDKAFMAGLNSDPTLDANFTSLDWAIYQGNDGKIYIYESGTAKGGGTIYFTSALTTDIFTVRRTGTLIEYLKNGTVFASSTAASIQKLYFDSSLRGPGASLTAITFSQDVWAYPAGSGSGIWEFDAVAELNYSSAAGATTAASNSGATSVESWYSAESVLPTNTASITVTAAFKSIKGDGISTKGYYYRTVTWTIQGWNGSTWVNLKTKSRNLSKAEHNIQISDTNSAFTTGYTKIRVYFVAANTNGTKYSLGANTYNYGQESLDLTGTTGEIINYPSGVRSSTVTLPAWSPPSGYSVYAMRYTARLGLTNYLSGNHIDGAWSISGYVNGTLWTTLSQSRNFNLGADYDSGNISATSYNRNYFSFSFQAVHYINAHFDAQTVTAFYRKLVANSTASANNFTFQSYAWNITGSTAITKGSLQWTATGD